MIIGLNSKSLAGTKHRVFGTCLLAIHSKVSLRGRFFETVVSFLLESAKTNPRELSAVTTCFIFFNITKTKSSVCYVCHHSISFQREQHECDWSETQNF